MEIFTDIEISLQNAKYKANWYNIRYFFQGKNKILYIILNYENIDEKYIRQFLIVKNKERITYKIHNSKIYAYSG